MAEASQRGGGGLRGIATRLGLLAITSFICLVLLEFAVRVAFPYFSPKTQIPFHLNPEGVALGPPNETIRQATPKGDFDTTAHFNADGLRDTKDLRRSTERDWFAVGDSFTLGWGLNEEQRYSNRLEQMLKTNAPPALVYNVAIPDNLIGYGRLLKYAERLAKVHHLIVGVCMENDLRDYRDGRSDWDPSDGNTPSQAPSWRARAQVWCKRNSALYMALSFGIQRSEAGRHWLEKIGVARSVDQLSHANEDDEAVLQSSRDQVVKLVKGYDAVVLIIPSRRLWHGATTETERRVHERFVSLLREAGLLVVDTKPALERGGKPLDYYFKTDPHWNAGGHEVAAAELFAALRSKAQGLVTPSQPSASPDQRQP